MKFNLCAVLIDKKVVPVNSDEFSEWFRDSDRTVKKTELEDGTVISTVFFGINHGHGRDAWFETMVFGQVGEPHDSRRYETWDEAVVGHDEIVSTVNGRV